VFRSQRSAIKLPATGGAAGLKYSVARRGGGRSGQRAKEFNMKIEQRGAGVSVWSRRKFLQSFQHVMAEGVGFEPTRGREPPGGFQDRCLKPLGHPSVIDSSAFSVCEYRRPAYRDRFATIGIQKRGGPARRPEIIA
jgi:hypothetical protein